MFSFKLKKISLRGRIDLNSPEDIVPTIVAKMPAFGRKKSTDKSSLFSDAIYEENLPFCDGRERHTVSDAYINYYVKSMIHDYRALGHLDDFEFEVSMRLLSSIAPDLHALFKRCCTYKHGSTWIIRSKGDDSISRLLKVLEKVVKVSSTFASPPHPF
jgi:hypothetical protein